MSRFTSVAMAFATAALPLSLALGGAQAAPVTYTIDPSHLSVVFNVHHLGFSNVYGRFNEASGEVVVDKDAIASSRVKFTIKAASIDTAFAKRDDHLRSPDFFNVKEFPEITFVSTKVEPKDKGIHELRLSGDLTMLGVTKPITLDVSFNKAEVSPASKKDTVGFSARGILRRSDFGMKYGVPNIGDEVSLILEAEANR